jgi:putative PIN family toxin of toxin-antitoxin system
VSPAPVVIDTNVALDLLVFGDRHCAALRGALEAGAVQWIGSAAMRDELACVLARGLGPRWPAPAQQVLALWDRHARLLPAAPLSTPACRDPDDQKFVDLALAHPARWLLTRDRALLQLARHAAARGLWIGPPRRWVVA